MADYRALMSVSEAIMNLLRAKYDPEEFNNELEFKVFTSNDFTNKTIASGVSLFPYRIYTNGAFRNPPGRKSKDGRVFRSKLPVELHCLMTIWAQNASLQNSLAGWVMSTLEDNGSIPANLLNSVAAGVFHADETVELSLADLTTEDLFRIWDVLGLNIYQLSIPYVVRVIEIDSMQYLPDGDGLVQQRKLILNG